MEKYQVIYADPPWPYYDWKQNRSTGAVVSAYSTMTIEDIKALRVKDISAPDSVLLLWVTFPKLEEAFEVIRAWGFAYKTGAFVWIKQNRGGAGIYSGLGYYTNGNAEFVLLGGRGHAASLRAARDIKQVMFAPLQSHSTKPAETRARIEKLFGDRPRIELFARQKVQGWDCWGNEVENSIEL